MDVFKDESGYAFVAIGSPGMTLATGQVNDPGLCHLYRADPDDYDNWTLILSHASNDSNSLLGIDVDIELMESGLVMAVGEPTFLDNQGVGEVDPGGFDLNQHIAGPGLGGGHIRHHQLFRRTVFLTPHRSHRTGSSIRLWQGRLRRVEF